jgi:hypothetical protein
MAASRRRRYQTKPRPSRRDDHPGRRPATPCRSDGDTRPLPLLLLRAHPIVESGIGTRRPCEFLLNALLPWSTGPGKPGRRSVTRGPEGDLGGGVFEHAHLLCPAVRNRVRMGTSPGGHDDRTVPASQEFSSETTGTTTSRHYVDAWKLRIKTSETNHPPNVSPDTVWNERPH